MEMTGSVGGMGRRVCGVLSGRLICCCNVWGQVRAPLGSGSPVSTHRCRFGAKHLERDPHLRGVTQPRETQDAVQAVSPVTAGCKKSPPFLGELVYSIALQVVVALHKTPTAKITKGPQPPVAALKLKYSMAFRNIDQLPLAGGKITIQPSKLLSFTLTWPQEHLQAMSDISDWVASSGGASEPWPAPLHAPAASQGFPTTHTMLPWAWLASPKWPALVGITRAQLCCVSPIA